MADSEYSFTKGYGKSEYGEYTTSTGEKTKDINKAKEDVNNYKKSTSSKSKKKIFETPQQSITTETLIPQQEQPKQSMIQKGGMSVGGYVLKNGTFTTDANLAKKENAKFVSGYITSDGTFYEKDKKYVVDDVFSKDYGKEISTEKIVKKDIRNPVLQEQTKIIQKRQKGELRKATRKEKFGMTKLGEFTSGVLEPASNIAGIGNRKTEQLNKDVRSYSGAQAFGYALGIPLSIFGISKVPKGAEKVGKITAIAKAEGKILPSIGLQVSKALVLPATAREITRRTSTGFEKDIISDINFKKAQSEAYKKRTEAVSQILPIYKSKSGNIISIGGFLDNLPFFGSLYDKGAYDKELRRQGSLLGYKGKELSDFVKAGKKLETSGNMGELVTLLDISRAGESTGRKLTAKAFQKQAGKEITQKKLPFTIFKIVSPKTAIAGFGEGVASEIAQQQTRIDTRKINEKIKSALFLGGFGAVSAGVIGGFISSSQFAKSKKIINMGKTTETLANIADPLEKPGDIFQDIVERIQKKYGKSVKSATVREIKPKIYTLSVSSSNPTNEKNNMIINTKSKTQTQSKSKNKKIYAINNAINNIIGTPTKTPIPTNEKNNMIINTKSKTQTETKTETKNQTPAATPTNIPINIFSGFPRILPPTPLSLPVNQGGYGNYNIPKKNIYYNEIQKTLNALSGFLGRPNQKTSTNLNKNKEQKIKKQIINKINKIIRL